MALDKLSQLEGLGSYQDATHGRAAVRGPRRITADAAVAAVFGHQEQPDPRSLSSVECRAIGSIENEPARTSRKRSG